MHTNASRAVLICAVGLVAAFFMPWVQFGGVGVSGYNLARIGSYGNQAWVIPVLAGVTILMSLTGNSNRLVGAVSGIVPLGLITYHSVRLVRSAGGAGRAPTQDIMELAGQVLAIGAWLTIVFSIGIIAAAIHEAPRARAEAVRPGS